MPFSFLPKDSFFSFPAGFVLRHHSLPPFLDSIVDIEVIAHLDLMKRYAYKQYGLYAFDDYRKLIQEILVKTIFRNIGIEINTSGLRTGLNQIINLLIFVNIIIG